MGTRALVGTSGGGFDLMTETFSLAGMIETPLVVIDCQRPGPATGMPTWTGQGDLKLAIHAGHGEYGRMVVSGSDPTSCYELIQHTLNYAEEFQVPTVFLTEKVICETQTMVAPFKHKAIPIKRGLVTKEKELEALMPTDRYKITKSGVSLRWLPGASKAGYYANGDEHREDGRLSEDAAPCAAMIDKRMRKMDALEKVLPEPEYFGAKNADIVIVGWGSTKNTVLDAIDILKEKGKKVGYLHYEYLWPLKTGKVSKLMKSHKNVHILEGNYRGQLANLIENKVHLKFKGRFLKYDGRPFFVEEVMDYIQKARLVNRA
jgi:2-oxoglutarate ferredoxin oxidoreductase subunit alpha